MEVLLLNLSVQVIKVLCCDRYLLKFYFLYVQKFVVIEFFLYTTRERKIDKNEMGNYIKRNIGVHLKFWLESNHIFMKIAV